MNELDIQIRVHEAVKNAEQVHRQALKTVRDEEPLLYAEILIEELFRQGLKVVPA